MAFRDMRKLTRLGELARSPRRLKQLVDCLRILPGSAGEDAMHLDAAMRWLCRAHDVAGGGGVSYAYCVLEGWTSPYPETTGYIIPTFLAYAKRAGRPEYRDRAIRMGEWELSVQSASGGIPGGMWPPRRSTGPISFDTGQVLQGWCALYRETRDPRWLEAARRAADWLVQTQPSDGAWRDKAPGRTQPTTFAFNTRSDWALLDLWKITGEDGYRLAALRHLDWTVQQQTGSGWFKFAGFSPDELPLTHTLAYVLEGLLECWGLTGEPRLLEAALRAGTSLLEVYSRHGEMRARIDPNWKMHGRSACVTGCSQIVRVWLLMASVLQDSQVRHAARSLLDQVKTWQILNTRHEDLKGALPGSFPVYGAYEPLRFQNWGAKFFADALVALMDDPEHGSAELGGRVRDRR